MNFELSYIYIAYRMKIFSGPTPRRRSH